MKVQAFTLSIALLFSFGNILTAQTDSEFQKLLKRAIEVSPKLKMLESKMEAVKNGIPEKSSLPDPVLSIGLLNMPVNSFSFTQEPMTGKMLSLSQGLPFPGKLSMAARVAEYDIDVIKEMISEEKNLIKKQLQSLYIRYHSEELTFELLAEKKNLLLNINEVVKTNYTVGKSNQQNIVAVDLSITLLEDKLTEVELNKSVALEKIRSILIDPSFILSGEYDIDKNLTSEISAESLTNLSLENRPLLKQSKILEQKASAMLDLAEYQYYPDFNFNLQYSQRDEIASTGNNLNDFVSVIIGFNLPINYGGKKTAKVDEAKSFEQFYVHQFNSQLQNVRIELDASVGNLKSFIKRIQLLEKTQLVQAYKNYSSALSAYQSNSIDFVNVLDAVNNIIDIEIKIISLKRKSLLEKANISYLIGYEL